MRTAGPTSANDLIGMSSGTGFRKRVTAPPSWKSEGHRARGPEVVHRAASPTMMGLGQGRSTPRPGRRASTRPTRGLERREPAGRPSQPPPGCPRSASRAGRPSARRPRRHGARGPPLIRPDHVDRDVPARLLCEPGALQHGDPVQARASGGRGDEDCPQLAPVAVEGRDDPVAAATEIEVRRPPGASRQTASRHEDADRDGKAQDPACRNATTPRAQPR